MEKRWVIIVILGIDPGYAIVGWGLILSEHGKVKPLAFGSVQTPAEMDFSERLCKIYEDFLALIDRYHPEAAAVEKLYFKNNQKTAIDVAEARGVLLLALKKKAIPLYEYTPLQVKSSVTGFGKAEKAQVMEMTRRRLGLESVPKPDDTADALAIAICHAQTRGTVQKQKILG